MMKAAAVPKLISPRSYNLALGGGTAVEMYYALKHYEEHHVAPHFVVLGMGTSHWQAADCFRARTIYFHYLTWEEEREATATVMEYPAFVPADQRISEKELLQYDFRQPFIYDGAFLKGIFSGRIKRNRKVYQRNRNDRGQMYFGTATETRKQVSFPLEFHPMPAQEIYVGKIAELCKAHGSKFIIVQLPLNPADAEKLRETGALSQAASYMKSLAAKYDIEVDTYFPSYEDDCFGDDHHVYEKGAERYSVYLKERLGLADGD